MISSDTLRELGPDAGQKLQSSINKLLLNLDARFCGLDQPS